MPISVADAVKVKPTPSYVALMKFLDAAPADKVFTAAEVMKGAGIASSNTVHIICRNYDMRSYRSSGGRGNAVYWGNPKAIAALKKALAEA